jgi:hypothetical protein
MMPANNILLWLHRWGLLIVWDIFLAVCVLGVYVVALHPAQAVELSITGSVSGQGVQNLSYAGDLLNVSILQNGTVWNLSIIGGAAA